MVKLIPLTQGKFAKIDEEDYAEIKQFKWYAHHKPNNWYARTTLNKKKMYMHRLILGLNNGQLCDHINGDGLDNRRHNLRMVTSSGNMMNRLKRNCNTTSKFKGVTFHKQLGKWQAQIQFNYKHHHLGVFDDETEAAKRYDLAARNYFGTLAKTNFSGEMNP